MFSSLLFSGLSLASGLQPEDPAPRPSSAPGAAGLGAKRALQDGEVGNQSPILRPSTAADNKQGLTSSDSVLSVIDAKEAKPRISTDDTSPGADENRAPIIPVEPSGDKSVDEVWHTPLVAAGSNTSLQKFPRASASSSLKDISSSDKPASQAAEASVTEVESLQVRRGKIEPLGVPLPATYADATHLATIYPEVADRILALPLSPEKAPKAMEAEDSSESADAFAAKPAAHTSSTPSKGKTSHTPSKPNWAMAPDASPQDSGKKKKDNRRRSEGHRERRKSEAKPRARRATAADKGSRRVTHADQQELPGPSKVEGASSAQDDRRAKEGARTPKKARYDRGSPYSKEKDNRTYSRKPGTSEEDSSSAGQNSRSALHLAQVDALIKELQRTRGLMESPGASVEKNGKDDRRGAALPDRSASVPPATISSPGDATARLVWMAGHDGVLRPDFVTGETRLVSAPPNIPPTVPVFAMPQTAFLPAGMQTLFSMPFAHDDNDEPHGIWFEGRPGTGPRRRSEPKVNTRNLHGVFPQVFEGSSRTPDSTHTGGVRNNGRRSRNPSGQRTMQRAAETESSNWRSSRMQRNNTSPPPRADQQKTTGAAASRSVFGPTLDEICAMKAQSSSSSAP